MHLPCFGSHPRTTLETCISWTPFGWNWSCRCAPTANGSKLKLTSKTGPSDPQHHSVQQVNSYWMHYLAVQKETEMRETLQGTKIKFSSVHISYPRGTLRSHCFKDEYMSTKEAHLFTKPKKISVCTEVWCRCSVISLNKMSTKLFWTKPPKQQFRTVYCALVTH